MIFGAIGALAVGLTAFFVKRNKNKQEQKLQQMQQAQSMPHSKQFIA